MSSVVDTFYVPLWRREGIFVLLMSVGRSVGPSVRPSVRPSVEQMVYDHNRRNYFSQNFQIFHADWSWWGQEYIDFVFTRSKVKVTRTVSFCKKWFSVNFLRTIDHRAIIFHMLVGRGEDKTPIDFVYTMLKYKVNLGIVHIRFDA